MHKLVNAPRSVFMRKTNLLMFVLFAVIITAYDITDIPASYHNSVHLFIVTYIHTQCWRVPWLQQPYTPLYKTLYNIYYIPGLEALGSSTVDSNK